MSSTDSTQKAEKFEMEAYKRPKSLKELKKTHVPFTGAPLKHAYDPEKIILVVDPFSTNDFYYEFRNSDISYAEKLPSIVTIKGETLTMARIWVKKMSLGIFCKPFLVEDIKT